MKKLLESLLPYAKYAKYFFALGVLLSIALGVWHRTTGMVLTGNGTLINLVLVLLGIVVAVLCLKNMESNQVLLGALAVILLSLVFPLAATPIPQVTALGGAAEISEVVPFIAVRLTISLLTVFLAPVAGLLGLKAIYKAVK